MGSEMCIRDRLDNLELRIDGLLAEWTRTLLDTVSDPIVAGRKKFLSQQQQQAIDCFISGGALPKQADDFFVQAISSLLKGFEPVVIDSDELISRLEHLPPMDEISFKANLNELIASYTKGKDAEKLRIVIKRRDNEV